MERDKWNWTKIKNPNLEGAKEREVARTLWRKFHQRTAAWKKKTIHSSITAPQQVRPNEKDGQKVEEPEDVEEIMAVLPANFLATSATNLDSLTAFR